VTLSAPDPALLYTFGLIPGAMISPKAFRDGGHQAGG